MQIRNKMLQHSFVTGFGSNLGQTFRPRQTKSGVCVGKRSDYFATIFALKEGKVLFNDALNTFYLRLYGVRHMVKDHSDSERVETRCCHMGCSFRLGFFYMHHPTDRITRPLLHQLWSTGWNEK